MEFDNQIIMTYFQANLRYKPFEVGIYAIENLFSIKTICKFSISQKY